MHLPHRTFSSLKPLALSISLALLGGSIASLSHAQSGQVSGHFQTQAGSLSHALNQLALQARVSILIQSSHAQGYQVAALNGQYTVDKAFATLLSGSPFQIAKTPAGYLLTDQAQAVAMPMQGSVQSTAMHEIGTAKAPPEAVRLSTIVVQAEKTQRDNNEDVFDQKRLHREMISDERQLVANTVGVSVVESGRSGSNGYAIRGVDTDRVAIVVDGMTQAESFMPDVYRGYGYFNGSRNGTELENISAVTVHKGANSFAEGSGALGGSVVFNTKSVDDFITTDKNWGGLAKLAYDTKNQEFRYVAGGALRYNDMHALLQYTQRDGHETKAFGDGKDIYGSARGLADPVDAKTQSLLAKVGYQPSDAHFFEASFENRTADVQTTEKSFSDIFGQHRLAEDYSPYARYRLDYIWTPENDWLKQLKTTLSHQEIEQQSITNGLDRDSHLRLQRYDRKFTQQQQQLSTRLNFQPFQAFGAEHRTEVQLQGQLQKFENDNIDTLYDKGVEVHQSRYNIIEPVHSKVFNFKALDQMLWSDQWSTQLGLRYDFYQHHPDAEENPEKSFNAVSFLSNVSYQPSEQWRFNYQLAQGFRAPKAEEMYFKFHRGNNHFDPNPELKAETALNHELSAEFKNEHYRVNASAFYSQYRNFIEERYTQGSQPNEYYDSCKYYGCKEIETLDIYKSINVDHAKVYGFELQTDIDLAHWKLPEGLQLSLSANIAKGSNSDGDALRSIQPATGIVQLSYVPEDAQWGGTWTTRMVAEKKEKDTVITSYTWRGVEQHTAKFVSSGYSVSDLTAFYQFSPRTLFNVGVFNILDKKYSTWDSLRSIPEFGTTNRIDYKGEGLDRFTSPGRNYSVSLVHHF